jgi:RNA polymerase sigma factor for flagellar operon FliA
VDVSAGTRAETALEAVSTPPAARRLTAEEAERLWRAWKRSGDIGARDRLVLSYSPMVRYLAAKKARELPSHCELGDLVSCGLLALIGAAERFDPARGSTFEQYAWTRVAGAILDELRRQDWAPRSARRLEREIERARERWFAVHGTSPNEAELARALKIGIGELRDRLEELDRASIVSLNAPARVGGEDAEVETGETVTAPPGDYDPEQATLASERSLVVRRAIEGLSDRERQVLTLLHVHHLAGKEIGKELGVSESRVSQILSAIRAKLREPVEAYDHAAEVALDRGAPTAAARS